MNSKEKYRNFCLEEKSIQIFLKDWWLDAVCGFDNWDVILAENKNNEIIAALPYQLFRKFGIKYIKQPRLTARMGIWVSYPKGQKYYSRLSYEKEVFNDLLNRLPKVDYFILPFHYNITNWLPFYWRGYQQTTCYSYVIEDISDLNFVFNNFHRSKREYIKRAEKNIKIKFDLPYQDFYEHRRKILSKQNAVISYSKELVKSIFEACYSRNAGKTIYAIDEKGNMHGAIFVIWDENTAYWLLDTLDPVYTASGASSLLIKEAIKYVHGKTQKFDFEGSMIESVEHSFRQYGGVQKPYFVISKINSRLLSLFPQFIKIGKKIIK